MRNPFHPPFQDDWNFEPVGIPDFGINGRTGVDHAIITNTHDGLRYVFERIPENVIELRWWAVGIDYGGMKGMAPFHPNDNAPIGDKAQIWLETEWEKVQHLRPSMN